MKCSYLFPGLLASALSLLLPWQTASATPFTVPAGPADTVAKTLTNNETGTVLSGGTLSISSGTAIGISGSGTVNVFNSGSILNTGSGRGIDSNAGTGTRIITNYAGGLIQTANADTVSMRMTGANAIVNNSGIIRSLNSTAGGNQGIDFASLTTGTNIVNNFATGLVEATAADSVRPGVNGMVNNWGAILARPAVETGTGLRLASSSDGVDTQANTGVTINNWGSIAGRHAITGEDPTLKGFTITINNFSGGLINGINGSGVNMDDPSYRATISNAGTIVGNFDSTRFDVGDGDGLDIDGLATIVNSGFIRGIGAGGLNDGSLNNSEGISIGGGSIVNLAGGEITGENNTGTASKGNGILVDDSNAGNAFAATTITNSGLIHGKSGFGVKIIGTFADTVINNAGGVIRGGGSVAALQTGGGNDIVVNVGAIISDAGQAIDLGEGNDSLTILGDQASIVGDATGGPGTDSLFVNGSFTFNHSFTSFENARFQGGTVVLNGTSTFDNGFSLGAGSLVFNGSVTVPSPAGIAISGASLVVNGQLTVPTAFGISLPSGSLIVNGQLLTPALLVGRNALLGGNGFISGSVVNAGTVSPGNSIGKLTIGGNYTQTSSGTLLIEIAGNGRSDVLVVRGTARLGGTLQIAALNRKVAFGDQYTFLRAGRIEGRFNRIEMPSPSILRGRLLIEGGSATLLVAPASYTLVAQSPNQVRVARALDQWIGIESGDIGEVTLALDLLTAEEYPEAFEAILPGAYVAAQRLGLELSQNHGQLLHQQLSARRLGQRAVEPVSTPDASLTASANGAKSVQKVAAPVQPASEDFRWNAWMQGSGLFSSGGLSVTPGEDFESGAFLVGADFAVTEHLALGVFASYQEGWGDYDNGAETDLDSVRAGLYATLDYGGFYGNAAVGGGSTDYSIQRPISWATLDRTARSSQDAAEFFSLAGAGHDFQMGNFTVGPQFSAQYTRLEMDGATETGAGVLNLAVDDTTGESFRTYLGGRMAYTIKASDRVAIIPELRVFWQHEFLQDDENIHAALNGGSGPGFNFQTSNDDEDAVFVGAGVGLQVGSRFYMNAYYNADFGRGDDGNHTVSVSANIRF